MAGHVPRPLTPLIGRVAELEAIVACVRSERLVSLVGAGGIGKTRLAIEAIGRDGREVEFVDLATVSSPDAVPLAVAGALGIRESGMRTVVDTIAHVLGEQPLVVVLDNCEHVVDACASLVEQLLGHCPGLAVLATSREPLGVHGEVVWRVPSLTLPAADAPDPSTSDAVQLFVDRARRARPSLTLSDDMMTSVAEICRRLDGIALAIELAATSVRVMPPDRILSELDHRFALLTGGPRTAMSRQQTLLASVEWSHDQLSDDERAVFRRLGVFSGSFPLEAAEAVGAGDGLTGWAVFDVMSRLVDKSLVVFDETTGWYRLLETLRLFAIERCEAAGELVTARTAHANWWREWLLAMGRDLVSEAACTLIDAGYPNLRTALRWLTVVDRESAHDVVEALSAYWYLSGAITDALTLSDDVLAGEEGERPARWARTVGAMGTTWWLADRPGVREVMDRAAAIARTAGDDLTLLRCELSDLRGNPDMTQLAHQADRALAHGERYLAIRILHTIALFDYLRGEASMSSAHEHVLHLLGDEGLEIGVGQAWLWDARQRCAAGDYRGAWDLQQAVLARPHFSRTPHTALYLLLDGAWYPLLLGDVDAFEEAAATARRFRRDWGRHEPLASMIGHLPALLAGDLAPPETLRSSIATLGTILLAFPPMFWVLFELLGPMDEPEQRQVGSELAYEARDAAAAFTAGEYHRAEPIIASLAARPREDAFVWTMMLATCLGARGAHEAACRVFGAVEAFVRSSEVVWLPTLLRERRAEALATCTAALGELRRDELLAEGAAMSLREAAAYASRARGERGRPTFGWESLTPTELDVVARVAEGLNNAAIAASLFMSVATVKTHLTHAYAKLGIASRAELAVEAARRSDRATSGP